MKKQTLFIILIIFLALTVGFWREHQRPSAPLALSAGVILPVAQHLPSFQLEDMDGNIFTQDSLKQRWSFLFFGYTACPDVCPTTLASLHELSQRLISLPALQFIFITLDPINDTKVRLKEYLGDKTIKGVTGEKSAILTMSQKLGVHLSEKAQETDNIEHTGTLFLINPDGKLTAVFSNGTKPYVIGQDLKKIIHHYTVTG